MPPTLKHFRGCRSSFSNYSEERRGVQNPRFPSLPWAKVLRHSRMQLIVGGKIKVPSFVIQTRAMDKLEYQSDQCLGIQTRATIEKGVTEDAKKRKPGLINKNKIYSSERDSLFDRIRLNSSLGGQSNNILSIKPKIFRHFRTLKHKKIYRPKKHYVSIQIPRKGYFYRSTVHSPSQESPSAALRRMELLVDKKIKSKVEISGLASTSAKVSDLPIEKIVKGKRKRDDEGEAPSALGPEAEAPDPLPPELLEKLTRAANDEASSYTFRHMLDEYLSSINSEESDGEGETPLDEMLLVNPEAKGNLQTSAILEAPTGPNFRDSTNSKRTSPRVGDDFSELLEISSENAFPTDGNQNNCGLQVAFDPLLRPLDTAFRREMLTCRLRTSALTLIREESSESIPPEGIGADEDSSRPAEASDRGSGNSQGEQIFTSEGWPEFLDFPLFDLVTDSDDFTSKTNALQIDICDLLDFIKSRNRDLQTEGEEFFDVDEFISCSSFSSAVSCCPPQVSDADRQTPKSEELSRPTLPKKFVSLTCFGAKPEENKKSKSENDLGKLKSGVSKKTRLDFEALRFFPERSEQLARDQTDKYERILPFDTGEAKDGSPTSELKEVEEVRTPRDDVFLRSSRRCGSGWSPTLPELTDIYRSILRESKRLNHRSANSLNSCFSSQILLFLKRKLKEKRLKKDLVDFSKSFMDSFRPVHWKPVNIMDPSYALREYVSVFQEILHSNLSVKQIVCLNNTLEGFYDFHEKTHKLFSDWMDLEAEGNNQWSNQKQVKKDWNGPGREIIICRGPEPEEMQRMTLPHPTELEAVLKRFNSSDESDTEAKSKLLVTVTLSGNEVLVNNFTYFDSDEALLLQEKKEKGTSQLIIENMTKNYRDRLALREKGKKLCKAEKSKSTTNAKKDRDETKEGTQGQRKNLPQQGSERPKEVPWYLYDQHLLRARHPIEAISEGPEVKIEKNNENSKAKSEVIREDDSDIPTGIKGALQKALAGKIYLKDLFSELGRGEEEFGKMINRTYTERPQAKRRYSSPKKKQAETVRSMFELKKSGSGKTQSLPGARSRSTYFCYPSVTSLQEKFGHRKAKDKIKGGCTPNQLPAAFKAKQTKNAIRPPNKWEPKKSAKEPSRPKLEPATPKRQTQSAGKPSTAERKQPTSQGEGRKTAEGEHPRPDGEGVSDCFSIELLVSDDSGSDLAPMSRNSTGNPPRQADGVRDVEQLEDSPILLHRSRSSADGTSFQSEIIHSDSFLKYCTPLRVTQSQLKSLFKCNSEVKFYPGRVCEGSDDPEPFVTFVLTPKQNETAGLPSDVVQVVQKNRASEPSPTADGEERANPVEGSLEAVEKFIAEMAELRKAAIERKKQSAQPKKMQANPTKCGSRNRDSAQARGTPVAVPPERKAYHECQKRKLASAQRNSAGVGVETPKGKQRRDPPRRPDPKRPEPLLDNFVKKTRGAFSGMLNAKGPEIQKANTRETMQGKATEVTSSENKVEAMVTDIAEAEWNPDEHEEEGYENIWGVPNEMLEAIKVAIARVDGFDSKEKIIEAIEDIEKTQAQKESETAEATSSRPKKSKTLRIKIRCKGLKPFASEAEKRAEGPPLRNREREGATWRSEEPTPEIALLDSLVAGEEGGRTLRSKNSTRFDTPKKDLENKAGGTRGVANDGASCATGGPEEGVPKPSSDSPTKKQTFQPSLTPSNVGLFLAASDKKETEDTIYKKISKYLEEGDVSHSMTLLDGYLKKTEHSLEDAGSRKRLRELLSLIENKSRNLLMSLEKNVWLKVLSLLEEAARLLEDEGVQQSKKAVLLEKIQSLNLRKLVDLQRLRASSGSVGNDDGSVGHVLGALRESLSFLRAKDAGQGTRLPGFEVFDNWEGVAGSSKSAIRIHSTEGVPEMRTGTGRSAKTPHFEGRFSLHMDQATSSGGDIPAPETDAAGVKMKLPENSFEEGFERENPGKGFQGEEAWPFGPGNGCWRGEKKSPGDGLCRRPGYVDLVRYFMKAWDARMSLSSLSKCRV